jgi:protein-disulfide isomerase
MNRLLPASAACALLIACQSQQAAVEQPASPAVARTAPKKCDEANLALAPTDIVGSVDGKPITAAELGPELAEAERSALRSYCGSVHSARTMALENHVRELLVDKKASAAGQDVETWLRTQVEARVKAPTEEEMQAFYKENVRPGAPPFEELKPQVLAAMERDRRGAAIDALIAELESEAKIVRTLPDTRPPALEVGVAEHTATAGPADAVVEVVEFADFECPYCQVMANALHEAKTRSQGKRVRFAYRHFPLSFHPNARPAAEISQCAHEQGKFWEMHDRIYQTPKAMDAASLRGYATELGLDTAKLDACLSSGRAAAQVDADLARGKAIGVEGTPTVYINGRQFTGNADVNAILQAIDAELEAGS